MEKYCVAPPPARRSGVRLPIRTLEGGLAWAGAARRLAPGGGEDKDEDGAAGHDADRHPRRRHAQHARRGMGMHKYKYSTVQYSTHWQTFGQIQLIVSSGNYSGFNNLVTQRSFFWGCVLLCHNCTPIVIDIIRDKITYEGKTTRRRGIVVRMGTSCIT
jgi:hypothetical protein